jgi:cytochrome c oxidase subunit 2
MRGVRGWLTTGGGTAFAGALLWLMQGAARAAEPVPWEMGFQPAASPVRDHIDALHNELLVIITLIALFVLGLLLYVIVRFNAERHPVPSKTSHNTLIEVLWTVLPVLILVIIAIPSFKLLYYMDRTQQAEMTLKVTGHQWYWTYEYPDQGNLSFDSYMIPEEDAAKKKKKRLLDVDNPVVVPVGTNIRILVTGTDVMHSWFVPSMGVQEYAVIGRVNESWMNVERPGTYYGQCNQICGVNHPFMPIAIQAMAKEDFAKWLEDAKKKFARKDGEAALSLAAAAPRQ